MKILLHICCGVCAGSVAERLLSEGHQLAGYFFNPNIHPIAEYEQRLEFARKVANRFGFPLELTVYEPEKWLNDTVALAHEPEGGKRCEVCYRISLQATYTWMKSHDFDAFTTTLTVSPHKLAEVVNRVGKEIGGEKFLPRDFKKQDGFKRATDIAKELGLYRQHYCGCVYSLNQQHRLR